MVSNTFYCHPYLAKIPILTNFFLQMAGLKPPTSFTLNIKEDDEPPQIDSKKGQNTILGLWDRCGTFLLGKKRSFVAMHGLKKMLPSKFGKFYVGFIFAKDFFSPWDSGSSYSH